MADIAARSVLSEEEEKVLFELCDRLSMHNFTITVSSFRQFVIDILCEITKNPHAIVGRNWISRHFQKWKSLYKATYSRRLDQTRAIANQSIGFFDDFFTKLRWALGEFSICAECFYNLDEKGFRMGEAATCKAIIRRGAPYNDETTQDGQSETATILECIAADGWVFDLPLVIYNGEPHNSGWSTESGFGYGYSNNGWIDKDLYWGWLKEYFEPRTRERARGRWRLLLVDGLEAHATFDICDWCWKHKIVVLQLPSHSTHLLQPLDVGCYSPYTHYYSQQINELSPDGRTGIGKHNFMDFLIPAREKVWRHIEDHSDGNIAIRCFKNAGIWPVDPQKAKLLIPQDPPRALSPPNSPSKSIEDLSSSALAELRKLQDNPTLSAHECNIPLIEETITSSLQEVQRLRAEKAAAIEDSKKARAALNMMNCPGSSNKRQRRER